MGIITTSSCLTSPRCFNSEYNQAKESCSKGKLSQSQEVCSNDVQCQPSQVFPDDPPRCHQHQGSGEDERVQAGHCEVRCCHIQSGPSCCQSPHQCQPQEDGGVRTAQASRCCREEGSRILQTGPSCQGEEHRQAAQGCRYQEDHGCQIQ